MSFAMKLKKAILSIIQFKPIIGLVVLNLILLAILIAPSLKPLSSFKGSLVISPTPTEPPVEAAILNNPNLTFDQLSKIVKTISEQKGAVYGYNVIRQAALPPSTDTHLLGHVVGDVLYKQQGVGGITNCTQEFRNACSHSIVVGALLEKGESALSEIAQACKQAPGGLGAYPMCYHGLGHGVLAFTGYDFLKTVELCQKVGTAQYHNREAIECIGGAVMETISGGGHDRQTWIKQRPNYLRKDDPLYLCLADFMPADARDQCLNYLTPFLWEAVGARLDNPQPEDFNQAFKLCNQLPRDDMAAREACFGGFGKEFVTLAQDRDIRKIDQMNEAQLQKVYNWCQLASNREGIGACLYQALNSIYWGGENNPAGSIKYCHVISDQSFQANCFNQLFNLVNYYVKDSNPRQNICDQIPDEYKPDCQNQLISPS